MVGRALARRFWQIAMMFVSRQGTTYEIANRIAPSIVDVLASYGAIRSTISPNAWFADFSMVHFFKDGYAKEFFNSICYLFGAMVERIAPYGFRRRGGWAWFETATRSRYACLDASSPQSGLVFINVKKETVRGEACIENEVRVSASNHAHPKNLKSGSRREAENKHEKNRGRTDEKS